MKLLCTDLDNTIIYSYKHNIGTEKINVELYEGRQVSFITNKTFELLNKVKEKYTIVPVTTRTIQQYERIDLGIGSYEYALTCNGGVLLKNGVKDQDWYEKSLEMISLANSELEKARVFLENDSRRTLDLRFIENLFLYTKCDEPLQVVEDIKAYINPENVEVYNNGVKVYVLPKVLSKGAAIQRLKMCLNPEYIVAAGDSEFDISMLSAANKGYAPYGFTDKFGIDFDVNEADEGSLLSEFFLESCLNCD